jgi:hypothetical protein
MIDPTSDANRCHQPSGLQAIDATVSHDVTANLLRRDSFRSVGKRSA